MLPMKEGIHKIKAIIFECISKAKNKHIESMEKNDKIATALKIIALLLLMHLEIKAVIVPEHAEISAIKDKIKAEWLTSMLQKSSINFFPITLCNT